MGSAAAERSSTEVRVTLYDGKAVAYADQPSRDDSAFVTDLRVDAEGHRLTIVLPHSVVEGIRGPWSLDVTLETPHPVIRYRDVRDRISRLAVG